MRFQVNLTQVNLNPIKRKFDSKVVLTFTDTTLLLISLLLIITVMDINKNNINIIIMNNIAI